MRQTLPFVDPGSLVQHSEIFRNSDVQNLRRELLKDNHGFNIFNGQHAQHSKQTSTVPAGIRQGFEALAKKVQEHHEYLKAKSRCNL